MKKYIYLCCAFIFLQLVTSCNEIDNRDAPSATLKGVLIDQVTKKPLITEQPNGFRIKLMEYSWSDTPVPLYFWGKDDGTFNNTKLFSGKYGIQPVEGAFFPVDEVILDIKETTTLDFEVIPYLTISEPIVTVINSTSVSVSYKISRYQVGPKIADTQVFVSEKTPLVGANIFTKDYSPMIDLSKVTDEDVLSQTFTQVIEKLDPAVTYYMRVGARTENPQRRYNFTEVVELKLK